MPLVDNIDVPPSGIILVQEIVLPFTQHDTRDGISMVLPVTSEDFKGNLYIQYILNCGRRLQNIHWHDRVKQSTCISRIFFSILLRIKKTNKTPTQGGSSTLFSPASVSACCHGNTCTLLILGIIIVLSLSKCLFSKSSSCLFDNKREITQDSDQAG